MSKSKSITVLTIFSLLFFLKPFCANAADLVWVEGLKKEDVFKMATEQDRNILLLAGKHGCHYCQQAQFWFNNSLRTLVEPNYLLWFVDKDTEPEIYKTLSQYTAEYDAHPSGLPILCIINPNNPDNDYSVIWAPKSQNLQETRTFVTPKNSFPTQALTWRTNETEALNLAVQQGKYLLKFVGTATSPNSQSVRKQLNESPLKEILDKDYILWFSSNAANAHLDGETYGGEDENPVTPKTLPYLAILDPNDPDNLIVEYWGYLDVATLEEILNDPFNSTQGYDQWVMDNWNKDKEEVFQQAKEQDKFVLLFVGRPTCPTCKLMSELLCNPENPFVQIIDDNYITLYKWFDDEDDRADVYEYIEEFYEERLAGMVRQLPWMYIINPDKEGESVSSMYRPYPDWIPDEETMRKFLAVDLLADQALNWYIYDYIVFDLAQAQNKYILKFVGNGTSPNSQKMMSLLQEEPFKQILEDNFILWYVNDDGEDCSCYSKLLTANSSDADEEETNTALPYISIINPDDPDNLLEEIWGILDAEALEEILKTYAVSNEIIVPVNKVTVLDNELLISSRITNEQISIYSLMGQSLASVLKNDMTIRVNTSSFPKGILIVRSSSGWSAKVLIK